MYTKQKSKCGFFTLIELLCVVGILAILMALLFPLLYQAKEEAKRTMCQSNIKQINFGTSTYTADHANSFPLNPHDHYYTWDMRTSVYISGQALVLGQNTKNVADKRCLDIFLCPSQKTLRDGGTRPTRCYTINVAFYHDNQRDDSGGLRPKKIYSVKNPSATVMMSEHWNPIGDEAWVGGPYHRWLRQSYYISRTGEKESGGVFIPRHYSRPNMGFVDGHIQVMTELPNPGQRFDNWTPQSWVWNY